MTHHHDLGLTKDSFLLAIKKMNLLLIKKGIHIKMKISLNWNQSQRELMIMKMKKVILKVNAE
jgi:hypothetical protein